MEEQIYCVYMTDAVKYISENIASIGRHYGSDGHFVSMRYYDMLHPKAQDNRSGSEIVNDVLKRAGLVVIR